ncbi:MAG: MinD/ParA family protein [Candidatus Bathyarchaeia archaeon]
MARTISIHSSRGGTGKSLISSNLTAIYASEGRNVALMDFDFRAPSLLTIFQAKNRVKFWVNDYLDGRAGLEDVIVDLKDRFKTRGKLLVGFANPEMEAMREIARKDRRWQMQALRRVIALKEELDRRMGVEIIIFDTSPGIQYSSVNAVVSADVSVVISTMDVLDIEGAQKIVRELYEPFEKRSVILVNKAIPHEFVSEESRRALLSRVKGMFTQPLIAIIPCYCDLLQASRFSPFALDRPDHPFSRALREVAKRLESI